MAAINRAKSIPNEDKGQETGKGLSAPLPDQVHLKNPMHTIDVLLLVSSFIHFFKGAVFSKNEQPNHARSFTTYKLKRKAVEK